MVITHFQHSGQAWRAPSESMVSIHPKTDCKPWNSGIAQMADDGKVVGEPPKFNSAKRCSCCDSCVSTPKSSASLLVKLLTSPGWCSQAYQLWLGYSQGRHRTSRKKILSYQVVRVICAGSTGGPPGKPLATAAEYVVVAAVSAAAMTSIVRAEYAAVSKLTMEGFIAHYTWMASLLVERYTARRSQGGLKAVPEWWWQRWQGTRRP